MLLALLTGIVTMMLEFVLQRMLAVQWGSSIEVWGSTIAVVLGGLAGGYLLGGFLVDRRPEQRLLGLLLALLALVMVVLALFAEPLLAALAGLVPGVRLGSLLGALLTLALPVLLLGAVCPIAVRLLYQDQAHVGRVAGQVYAISTIGSIIGALVSAFYLLSSLQATIIILIGATIVALLAALVLRRWAAVALVALPVVSALVVSVFALRSAAIPGTILDQQASRYQNLYVLETASGTRQLVSGHPRDGIQSEVDPNNPDRLVLSYVQQLQRWNCLAAKPENIVILGGGAATLARAARITSPKAKIKVVELDPAVLDISRRWLSLPQSRQIRYFEEDGRAFLKRDKEPIDLLIVDTFSRGQVPAHLLSAEFFALARSRLSGRGLLAMNVLASPDSEFTASLVAAMRQSFAQVEALQLARGGGQQNLLLFAGADLSAEESCLRRVEKKTGLARGSLSGVRPLLVPAAEPFTDQRGPVEAN